MSVRMSTTQVDGEGLVRAQFDLAGIAITNLDVRAYPEETIYVVFVNPNDFAGAAVVGNEADTALADEGLNAFVTVRRAPAGTKTSRRRMTRGVHDERS